jgi:hypothetical protein
MLSMVSRGPRRSRYVAGARLPSFSVDLDCLLSTQLAIETLSTILATDFKAGEIELAVVSTAADEPQPNTTAAAAKDRGVWRVLGEEEKTEWLVRVGEQD